MSGTPRRGIGDLSAGCTFTPSGGTAELTQYVYNQDNRLVGIALPNGVSNAFEYDANGLRTKKADSTGTTRYLLDGLSVIAEYAPSGTRQALYVQSLARIDEVLSFTNTQGKYWYQTDALGSVYTLTTSTGAVQARGGYDVFGEPVALSGTAIGQPFGFTGREHEADSGLVYARARYLLPGAGRWDRVDPAGMPDGPNRYSYALMSPTRWIDVTGRRIDLRSDPQMWQLLLSATSTPIGFSWYFYATLIPDPSFSSTWTP